MENVVVLGASNKEERYSNMAVALLKEHGHRVFPIHPLLKEILDLKVFKNLQDLPENPDTISIYLNAKVLEGQIENIINVKPKRVIFNPGTEFPSGMERLKAEGIDVVVGCTLVMLKTGQF
jgi:uncharacterized protein